MAGLEENEKMIVLLNGERIAVVRFTGCFIDGVDLDQGYV